MAVSRAHRVLALVVIMLLLAGCGATSVTGSARHTPIPAPTLAPWSTVPTTPTPTPSSSLTIPCDPILQSGNSAIVTMGDFQALMQPNDFSYPARKLPDGLPLAPFKLDTQLPSNPATNPKTTEPWGMYSLSICNNSKVQAHALDHVSVQIASYTAYGGQVNEWESGDTKCATIYARPQGVSGGGCGGGLAGIACFHATFTGDAAVGNSVSASLTSEMGCMTGGMLPLPLPQKQELSFALGITKPNSPGIYTFTISVTTDAGTITFAPTAPVLLAPIAHKWSGEACNVPAMQAQIPAATNPPTAYICPA